MGGPATSREGFTEGLTSLPDYKTEAEAYQRDGKRRKGHCRLKEQHVERQEAWKSMEWLGNGLACG